MSDNENAVNQQSISQNFLWRTECITLLNSVQSTLSMEMAVSKPQDFYRIKPLLEEVITLRYKFISFYLDSEL